MDVKNIFATKKFTENGDITNNTTSNNLLDILFMSEYYRNHLNEVQIGSSEKEQLFSMFIRDPRYGLGIRELGKQLMLQSGVSPDMVIKAGRFDDLFLGWETMTASEFSVFCAFLYNEIERGNELCKKWMPRYAAHNKVVINGKKVKKNFSCKELDRTMLARKIAKEWGMNKQQYGHFIKCNTVENKMSRHNTEEIDFSKVPSLAMLKYFKRFATGEDTKERFIKFQKDVASGKAKLNVSTTNVYDIYKNRHVIDPDLFFDKLEKVSINCLVCVDSSGSMQDSNDSYGKAVSIGHYLTKYSSFMPGSFISFSSHPVLMELQSGDSYTYQILSFHGSVEEYTGKLTGNSKYEREIQSMCTGDCSNTDFRAVCELLKNLDKNSAPEYIVVLTDMEFDSESHQSADELQKMFKEYGFNTNIIWWNFNSRNKTVPFRSDEYGNIFMSGYNPMMLKFMENGFNGEQFLNKLLEEYKKRIM